jgi:hypothetical protein
MEITIVAGFTAKRNMNINARHRLSWFSNNAYFRPLEQNAKVNFI